jgi:Leucine-rich repeat (LRR) protein
MQLQSNKLSGSIPSSLSRLTRLQSLDLNRNSMTGSIPAFIGPLRQLQFLDLSLNRLTGAFPSDFCSWTQADRSHPLSSLLIKLNRISGTLNFSSCIFLSFLDASSNNLTSVVAPPGYSKLNIVSLGNNSILDFSSLLASNYIVDMNVDYQGWSPAVLAPTIPDVSQLQQIRSLSMVNNSLRGSLPSDLFSINSLQVLNLGNNFLTGTIPVIEAPLQKLDLNYNFLSGTIPQSMVQMLGYTTSFVNLKMNMMSCCGIGKLNITLSGSFYYNAYNYSAPRLPAGLVFSKVLYQYSTEISSVQTAVSLGGFYRITGNLGNRTYPGLSCPYLMLVR